MSELLKNVERTMYTFNFNNIVELCFNKVVQIDPSNGSKKLTEKEKICFDNCIDKYMLAFGIVKDTTNTHLEGLFSKR
jgi:hypothetical protein